MLLLHTIRTQIEYTERIVPLLADDFQIVVPDLPGHGRSSKSLARPYDAAPSQRGSADIVKAAVAP